MNVLVVAATLPHPPDQGGKIRLYNLLTRLSNRHRIELVALIGARDELAHVAPLEQAGLTVHVIRKPMAAPGPGTKIRQLSNPVPSVVRDHASSTMRRVVREIVDRRRPDLIHCEQIEVAQYAPALPGLPTLLTEHAIESQLLRQIALARPAVWSRMAGLVDAAKLRHYEGRTWPRFTGCMTVSNEDAAILRRRSPSSPLWIVSNGVDTTYFAPSGSQARSEELVLTGTIAYHPNLDGVRYFLRDIWPRISIQHPEVRVSIVGLTNPAAERLIGHHVGVTLTGWVPDVRPYAARAKVFIVPLRIGGGTRLKILEAFAQGVPVVSTSIGCSGLDVIHGEHLLIADEPAAFAEAVSRLLTDRRLWERLARNGRQLATERYDWAILADRLDQVYAAITQLPPT